MYVHLSQKKPHCCFIECEFHHRHNTEKTVKFLWKERNKETDGRWLTLETKGQGHRKTSMVFEI